MLFQTRRRYLSRWMTLLLLVSGLALAGCGQTPPASASTYESTLPTDYSEALSVSDQLAFGTLRLENTVNAVSEAQAATLLPLWQGLQDNVLKNTAERSAVISHIEATLTQPQIDAIIAMQLTQIDAQAWEVTQTENAPYDEMPNAMNAGSSTDRANREARQAQNEGMSDADRQAMREQFDQQGGNMEMGQGKGNQNRASASDGDVIAAVITLLNERSESTQALEEPSGPTTPAEEPAGPAAIAVATVAPELSAEPTESPTPATTPDPIVAAEATPASNADSMQEQATAPAAPSAALTQIPDSDPGPPLAIEVTTNTAIANPNLEGGTIYRVAGLISNPSEQTYAVSTIHVTFYDADGFRGAFTPFSSNGGRGSREGEYIWHGALEAQHTCALLAPGQACPFSAEIAAQNMGSFLVHPDAVLSEWHTASEVTVSDTRVESAVAGYAIIRGTVSNPNPYALKYVNLSGVLLDESGQIVSMGALIVTQVAANTSVPFEIRVAQEDFVNFEIYAQAEQE